MAFVEAMAAGLPAIGARGEGGPEDIAAAGPGLVRVPPEDHVALARRDRAPARRPGGARGARPPGPGDGCARLHAGRAAARRRSPRTNGRCADDGAPRHRPAVAGHHARAAHRGRRLRRHAAQGRGVRGGGGRADRRHGPAAAVPPGDRPRRDRGRGPRGGDRAARHDPRAVVVSTTTAAMLAPLGDRPYAVRFDAPATLNRPGRRNAIQHALERRRLAEARLLLPLSHAAARAVPAGSARSVVVPMPIAASGPTGRADGSPWPTRPTRRPRGSTCSARRGGWRPSPTPACSSSASMPSGGAPSWPASASPSPRGSNGAGRSRATSSAPRCGRRTSTSRAPAGRTGGRPSSRRSPTARCWPRLPPAGRSRRSRSRARSTPGWSPGR